MNADTIGAGIMFAGIVIWCAVVIGAGALHDRRNRHGE